MDDEKIDLFPFGYPPLFTQTHTSNNRYNNNASSPQEFIIGWLTDSDWCRMAQETAHECENNELIRDSPSR